MTSSATSRLTDIALHDHEGHGPRGALEDPDLVADLGHPRPGEGVDRGREHVGLVRVHAHVQDHHLVAAHRLRGEERKSGRGQFRGFEISFLDPPH